MQINSLAHSHGTLPTQAPGIQEGRLGNLSARPVDTDAAAKLLAGRNESPQGGGLLSRILAQISRPFAAVREWIGNLLGHSAPRAPQAAPQAQTPPVSAAELKLMMQHFALKEAPNGLAKAGQLADVTAANLLEKHSALATGNGALRSVATALKAVKDHSQNADNRSVATTLLDQKVAGISLQQWATVGGQASAWLQEAAAPQLAEAAQQLNQLASDVSQLEQAVGRELRGEPVTPPPADKLADALLEHFGLEAEQYLDEPKDGQASAFSDGEVMAIGLYTNGEYQPLNRALRAGKELDQGQSAIAEGLSSAFGKVDADETVVKTFRGTRGGDAFSGVAEGQKGQDAGYLSTSMNAQTAKDFGNHGTQSTVFGKSGLDVSAISIEANEQEILYNKDTEMTVLFSAKDSQGVTKRVLEESALSADSGRQKGLLDALDLPAAPKAQAGDALSQDPRLRLRGLDLA
ncbi:ADP-ribosyltransferase [Pseudomonas purpurea]|uniref:ADP-ribosyltransferase n=1 Tax=Pseudomonas purpurea TaxID=3136737 RepID=UPI003264E33E